MSNKSKRDTEWAKAKRVCRLNAETVRMAKELGMSPRSLMKNVPSKSQRWKAPVHVWVRELYAARRGEGAHKKTRKLAMPVKDVPDVQRKSMVVQQQPWGDPIDGTAFEAPDCGMDVPF